jgi:chromosome segregation ATPase
MSLENLKAQRQAILQKISKDPKNKKFHQHSLSAVEQQIREFELAAKKNAQSKGGTDDNAMEAEIMEAIKADAYMNELAKEYNEAQDRRENWQKKLNEAKSENSKKVYTEKISEEESEIQKYDQEIAKRRDEIIQSITANLSEEEDVEEVEVEEVAAKTDAQAEGSESKSKEELEELIEQKRAELEEAMEVIKILEKGTEAHSTTFAEIRSLKEEISNYENELKALDKAPIPLTQGAVKEMKIAAKVDASKTDESKPELTLEEINKLSLTRTATTIADTFVKINESSEHLNTFLEYQKGLNNYLDKTENVTQEMKDIIEKFKDFNINLKAITNKTQDSIELQKQFKDSLEIHFPTISDHREVWRSQIDELNQDVKKVYQELYNYFKEQTEQVKNYVENNNGLLGGIDEIKNAVQIFVENSDLQKAEFDLLQKEMNGLRNDFKESQRDYNTTMILMLKTLKEIKQDAQKETIETSEALTKAIKDLNTTIGKLTKSDKKEN